jgi:hypothetical protein
MALIFMVCSQLWTLNQFFRQEENQIGATKRSAAQSVITVVKNRRTDIIMMEFPTCSDART